MACEISSDVYGRHTPLSAPSDLLISLIWTGARAYYGQVGCHAHRHIGLSSELHAHTMSTLRLSGENENRKGWDQTLFVAHADVPCWSGCFNVVTELIVSIPDPRFYTYSCFRCSTCAINQVVPCASTMPVILLHVNCV